MMFSKNGRISEKQLRRMLVLSTFASLIFVLPYLSARFFGESLCVGLLLFCGLEIVYLAILFGFVSWHEKKEGSKDSTVEDLEGPEGKTRKRNLACALLQTVRLWIRLAFYVLLAIKILGEAQVPFMLGTEADCIENFLVVLPLLLVALYGAGSKAMDKDEQHRITTGTPLEKQARLHELLFWVLFIPFILVVLFGLSEVDFSVFTLRLEQPVWKLLLYSYGLLTFVLPVEHIRDLQPWLFKKEKKGICFAALVSVFVLAALLALLLIGIYGIHGAAEEEMLTISIMRYIRLPMGVLERFDVLMVWFFMTGCFVLICSTLFYGGEWMKQLCPRISKIWLQLALLAVSLLVVWLLPSYSHAILLFVLYGAVVDVPVSIVLAALGGKGAIR